MKYAAIVLLLTSSASASTEQVRKTLSTMPQKDLVELMGKLSQDPQVAKQIESSVNLGQTSDQLVGGWHAYTDWAEQTDAALQHVVNEAADNLPGELRQAEAIGHANLDEFKGAVDNALSPENIAQTKKNLSDGLAQAHGALSYGVAKDIEDIGKFKKAYNNASARSLKIWQDRKAHLDASAKELADAAENVQTAAVGLETKLHDMPEYRQLMQSLQKFGQKAAEFNEEGNQVNEAQWDVTAEEFDKAFHEEFDEFEDEFEHTIGASKKGAAPVSFLKVESTQEVKPVSSGYGWGSMVICASAVAGSAYMYNQAQKKTDQYSKASEGLI